MGGNPSKMGSDLDKREAGSAQLVVFPLRVAQSAFGNNPDCMHNSRDVAEQGENDVESESTTDANLQKHSQGWEEDGTKHPD